MRTPEDVAAPYQAPPQHIAALGEAARALPRVDTGLVDAAVQLVVARLPLFVDDPRLLAHADLHWENLMTDGQSLTAILDFERARPAAADLELDVLLRFSHWPHFPVAPDYEATLHPADFSQVPTWLAEAYPELFAGPHLRERLEVYAVVHDLRQGIQFPGTARRDAAAFRDLEPSPRDARGAQLPRRVWLVSHAHLRLNPGRGSIGASTTEEPDIAMRTLVHISDTHILPTADDRLQGVDTLRNLRDVLQYVVDSGTRPDALVVSGDLANGGEPESYRRLRHELDQYAERLGAELVVAIGNHDARPAFRQAMLDGEPTGEPVEYVRWIGGLRLIVLDSTVAGVPWRGPPGSTGVAGKSAQHACRRGFDSGDASPTGA